MAISNEKEFKAKLGDLSLSQQRQVTARFVQRVFGLSNDVRVKAAMEVAMRPDISDAELTIQQGGDGEDSLLVAQDGFDDVTHPQADGVVGRALALDDLVGRAAHLVGDLLLHLILTTGPIDGTTGGETRRVVFRYRRTACTGS